ncbi:MAG: SoxR reducing system RseC family protein [Pseudomonadota bacterium]
MNASELIWQPAIVVEFSEKRWLEFPSLSACARCRAGKGCGAGVFGLFFAGRRPRLAMPLSERWQPGDGVRVGVSARQLMRASIALYCFPLLCFMLGIVVSTVALFPNHEFSALLTGIVCAIAGLMVIRSRALRFEQLVIEPMSDQTDSQNCESRAVD